MNFPRRRGFFLTASFFSKDIIILKLVKRKLIQFTDQNFKEQSINDFPNINIIILNGPDEQYIAVEKNIRFSYKTFPLIQQLQYTIQEILEYQKLKLYIEPVIEKKSLWTLIRNYKDNITQLRFNIIKPNLANISYNLQDSLKSLSNTTQAHKMHLNLIAADKSRLTHLDPENGPLNQLVNYAAEGGGTISFKAKGVRHTIKTINVTKEIEMDEITIEMSSEQLDKIIKTSILS